MTQSHVEIDNVVKRFGNTVAVDHLSIRLEKGKLTTLLGPSGCGKTTLLRMVAGFIEPDSGEIRIGGVTQIGLAPHMRSTSTVFQDYALFPHMTVRENVSYGLKVRKMPAQTIRKKVDNILELLALTGVDARFPRQLSGGQQQRVALARSLVTEPEVLLMDEPMSNLDAKLRNQVRVEIKRIQQQLGITTLYVTHDQEEALFLSDVVTIMKSGRIQQMGSPEDVYFAPMNAFVADFIGSVNLIPAQVVEYRGDFLIVLARDQRWVVTPAKSLGNGVKEVSVCIRPETIKIMTGEPPPQEGINAVKGKITFSVFLGSIRRYHILLPSGEVVVDQPSDQAVYHPGDEVWLTFAAARTRAIALSDEAEPTAKVG